MNKTRTLSLVAALVASGPATATVIEYEATNLVGNTWQYDYTVTNDTLGFDIEELTIFFDLNLYENLASPSGPAGWDPIVIQPDPALPDDGFYDALALVAGIAPNASLGGFSVVFDYLGTDAPGAQLWNIVDPFTFETLEAGLTVLAQPTAPVPAPPVLWLGIAGLIAGFGARRIA